MKSRFTCLDVYASCLELAPQVIGARLQNIYDINSKTFLFKLNPKEGDQKVKLVVESGTRLHQTSYDFESGNVQPSFFAMKLRKYLRDRRVTGFRQCGFDRVVHVEFGHVNPEQVINLYFEFYSAGNIVLTNHEGVILQILRIVTNSDGEAIMKLGSHYTAPASKSLEQIFADLTSSVTNEFTPAALKKLLKEKFSSFSTPMVNHLVNLASSIDIISAVKQFRASLLDKPAGFLTFETVGENEMVFIDFHSFPFSSMTSFKEFPSFNEAVDEFYSKIELQKSQKAVAQQERDALQKIEAIRSEQNNRIAGLEAVIESYLKKAQVVDAEPKKVQDAISVIKAALDAGMDWTNFELIIEEEKRKGNPTAQLMSKLKLEKNIVTLGLTDPDSDETIQVDINVALTPHANATSYYDLRRTAIEKLARTKEAMEKAMKSAERKIRQDLKQSQTKAKRQQVFSKRKHLWFEKFNWFISSDNFLVLAGRDMQQNELLVKRYLREGDVYVHADMHGASSVIIKGRRLEDSTGTALQIPPRTLSEAGTMSLCNSRAWEAKIVTSAWWVYASQVSKTAPSGEFLPTGSFMIRGKKNFLPPAQLLYGFGFMFVLDDEAKEKQRLERIERDKCLLEGQEPGQSVEKYMSMLDIDPEEPVEEINVTSNMPKTKQIKPEKSSRDKKKNQEINNDEKTAKGGSRGNKGKQKKIAKKYADQDEEERALRMALLASQKKKESVEEPKPKREEKRIPENANLPASEKPVLLTMDDFEEEKEVGEDEMGVVDALTGNLRGNLDHVLYAIPVAGPISALTSYSFRLKLMPGSLKRGKAVQQALSILLSDSRDLDVQTWSTQQDADETAADTSGMFKRVKEMIRSIPDADLNQTMLGHVKIMATTKEIQKSKKDLGPKKSKKNKYSLT